MCNEWNNVSKLSHFMFTVKPTSASTRCHQPPILGGWIPGDESISSINHLQWPATCKRRPPDTYLYQNHPKSPVCCQWLPYWKCDSIELQCYTLIGKNIIAILLSLVSNEPVSAIVMMGCLWYTGMFIFWLYEPIYQ